MKPIDHKAIYRDGKHYDALNNFDTDIPFYTKMSEQYGEPILELACGTGRITIPLAQKGFDVTGIDLSEGMLKEAKNKAAQANQTILFQQADMRNFDLQRQFALILLPFNALCHLHDFKSIAACFQCVKKHLLPHGRFIIDVFRPDFRFLLRDPNKRYDNCSYPNPYLEEQVVITENNVYHEAEQINYIKWYFAMEGKEVIQELNMRMFFPQELDNYLRFSGFEIEAKFGNNKQEAFTQQSPKQLIISRFLAL